MANRTAVPVWKNVLAGSLGGVAGVFAMNHFQPVWSTAAELLFDKQPEPNRAEQPERRQQDKATLRAADAMAEFATGHHLTEQGKERAGLSVHYGAGVLLGAVYGLLASFVPAMTAGRGLVYGSAAWLVADEIGMPAAGLSGPPTEVPASVHANSLASHLVYGVTTDVVRRLLV
jgi:uncharacterized membrane protein YagU involved in acid resistance